MKNVMLLKLLLSATVLQAQTTIQPIASGDYWRTEAYSHRLPQLANATTFPTTIRFANGYVGIQSMKANKGIGVNEVHWNVGSLQNATDVQVEFSRDLRTFELAGLVHLDRIEGGSNYVFKHSITDNRQLYYRLALVRNGTVVAHTPAVQLPDIEHSVQVFPTLVKGSTFYVQTGQLFEKLQVVNSGGTPVYEKGLSNQTGTITIGLPSLPMGLYFVRLLNGTGRHHVQRILVE